MPFTTLPTNHTLHYTDSPPTSTSTSTPTTNPTTTLILIHGLGSTSSFYAPIIPGLCARGFRCVSFDNYLAGRSFSEREFERDGGRTSVEGIAGDVLALMDVVRVERAVVVGYSMGGMLPTYLAATAPDRVLAAVCIGPVHPSPGVADVFRQRIPVVQEGGMETMATTIPSRATGPGTTDLQRAFIREMLLAQDPRGYIANCRAIENATPPEYAKVKCPTLIVAGSEDKSAPVEGCEVILKGLGTEEREKKLVVMEGVGHWFCVERAEEVEKMVGGWVEGLKL